MRKSGGVDPQLLRAGVVLTCSAVGGAFDFDWRPPVVRLVGSRCAGLATGTES